jgi:hypothetical protein
MYLLLFLLAHTVLSSCGSDSTAYYRKHSTQIPAAFYWPWTLAPPSIYDLWCHHSTMEDMRTKYAIDRHHII